MNSRRCSACWTLVAFAPTLLGCALFIAPFRAALGQPAQRWNPQDGGGGTKCASVEVTPAALDVGLTLTEAIFSIRKPSGPPAPFTISSTAPWAQPVPSSGVVGGVPLEIDVLIDRSGLADGVFVTELSVATGGGPGCKVSLLMRNDADPADLASFPYFVQWMTDTERDMITPENRDVLLRPLVGTLYAAPNHVAAFRDWYYGERPAGKIGYYFTGTFASPPDGYNTLPRKLPNAPEAWLLHKSDGVTRVTITFADGPRTVFNHLKPEVRKAVIDFWAENYEGWDFIFVDNIYYRFTSFFDNLQDGATPEDWWAAVRSLLREHREQNAKPIIINCATQLAETWPELIPLVDGLHSEAALNAIYHIDDERRAYWIGGELSAFRQALDQGRTVLLTNNDAWAYIDNDADYSQPAVLGPLLSAVVCLVRNPGEPMYYHTNGNLNNDFTAREYHRWWRMLGDPLGPYTFENMVFSRDFQFGRVELDITTRWPKVRVNYSDPATQDDWSTP